MTLDVMLNEREWRKEHRPGWLLLVSAAAIYAATLFLYHYEMQFSWRFTPTSRRISILPTCTPSPAVWPIPCGI